MEELSNDLLLRAYERAVEIELDEAFLEMLREELAIRGLIDSEKSANDG